MLASRPADRAILAGGSCRGVARGEIRTAGAEGIDYVIGREVEHFGPEKRLPGFATRPAPDSPCLTYRRDVRRRCAGIPNPFRTGVIAWDPDFESRGGPLAFDDQRLAMCQASQPAVEWATLSGPRAAKMGCLLQIVDGQHGPVMSGPTTATPTDPGRPHTAPPR